MTDREESKISNGRAEMADPGGADERLFDRYRQGETRALRWLMERYQGDVLRFLYRLVGDRQAAEDVFQDTFLQVHLSQHTFDGSRRFKPWLFTIAANKGRDLLRKKGRRPELELSAPVRGGSGGGEGATAFIDLMEADIPGPSTGLDAEDRDRMVQRALGMLSPTLREILLLAYFQRLSYAQISDDLEIPLGTVKSRLHAAVASFAKSWQTVQRESEPDSGSANGGDAR